MTQQWRRDEISFNDVVAKYSHFPRLCKAVFLAGLPRSTSVHLNSEGCRVCRGDDYVTGQ